MLQNDFLTEGSHWNNAGFLSSASQPAMRSETPNGRTPLWRIAQSKHKQRYKVEALFEGGHCTRIECTLAWHLPHAAPTAQWEWVRWSAGSRLERGFVLRWAAGGSRGPCRCRPFRCSSSPSRSGGCCARRTAVTCASFQQPILLHLWLKFGWNKNRYDF